MKIKISSSSSTIGFTSPIFFGHRDVYSKNFGKNGISLLICHFFKVFFFKMGHFSDSIKTDMKRLKRNLKVKEEEANEDEEDCFNTESKQKKTKRLLRCREIGNESSDDDIFEAEGISAIQPQPKERIRDNRRKEKRLLPNSCNSDDLSDDDDIFEDDLAEMKNHRIEKSQPNEEGIVAAVINDETEEYISGDENGILGDIDDIDYTKDRKSEELSKPQVPLIGSVLSDILRNDNFPVLACFLDKNYNLMCSQSTSMSTLSSECNSASSTTNLTASPTRITMHDLVKASCAHNALSCLKFLLSRLSVSVTPRTSPHKSKKNTTSTSFCESDLRSLEVAYEVHPLALSTEAQSSLYALEAQVQSLKT